MLHLHGARAHNIMGHSEDSVTPLSRSPNALAQCPSLDVVALSRIPWVGLGAPPCRKPCAGRARIACCSP